VILANCTFLGCNGSSPNESSPPKSGALVEKAADDHSGWWCNEHGIPEEICGQCNAKYASECKKKGDWCDKHDRPDSQCFVCHPELEAQFAARYQAKYGKNPPKPTL
jgi:cobalt-zinc-cadmium efflux system membrane fusion protein